MSLEDSPKRPVAITILCLVGFVTVTCAMIGALLRDSNHGSPWLYLRLIGSLTVLASFCGIWQMRRWAIALYVGAVGGNMITFAASGSTLTWPHFAVPLLIVAVALAHYRSMQ